MRAFSAQSFAPFAFSAIAWAIEGLIEEIANQPPKPQDGGGSKRGKSKRRGLTRRQLLDDDDAVLMAIVNAVTIGALA